MTLDNYRLLCFKRQKEKCRFTKTKALDVTTLVFSLFIKTQWDGSINKSNNKFFQGGIRKTSSQFDIYSDKLHIMIFVYFMTNGSISIIFVLSERYQSCSFTGHQLFFECYLGLRINRENSNVYKHIYTNFIKNKKNYLSYFREIFHID